MLTADAAVLRCGGRLACIAQLRRHQHLQRVLCNMPVLPQYCQHTSGVMLTWHNDAPATCNSDCYSLPRVHTLQCLLIAWLPVSQQPRCQS